MEDDDDYLEFRLTLYGAVILGAITFFCFYVLLAVWVG